MPIQPVAASVPEFGGDSFTTELLSAPRAPTGNWSAQFQQPAPIWLVNMAVGLVYNARPRGWDQKPKLRPNRLICGPIRNEERLCPTAVVHPVTIFRPSKS